MSQLFLISLGNGVPLSVPRVATHEKWNGETSVIAYCYFTFRERKRVPDVLWAWQTCNEFGFYQTTDYNGGIFGNPVPLK